MLLDSKLDFGEYTKGILDKIIKSIDLILKVRDHCFYKSKNLLLDLT